MQSEYPRQVSKHFERQGWQTEVHRVDDEIFVVTGTQTRNEQTERLLVMTFLSSAMPVNEKHLTYLINLQQKKEADSVYATGAEPLADDAQQAFNKRGINVLGPESVTATGRRHGSEEQNPTTDPAVGRNSTDEQETSRSTNDRVAGSRVGSDSGQDGQQHSASHYVDSEGSETATDNRYSRRGVVIGVVGVVASSGAGWLFFQNPSSTESQQGAQSALREFFQAADNDNTERLADLTVTIGDPDFRELTQFDFETQTVEEASVEELGAETSRNAETVREQIQNAVEEFGYEEWELLYYELDRSESDQSVTGYALMIREAGSWRLLSPAVSNRGFLKSSAESTGAQSSEQVTSQVEIITVTGTVSDNRVTNIKLNIKLRPGSAAVDLTEATVLLANGAGQQATLTSGDRTTDASFGVINIKTASEGVLDDPADRAQIEIDASQALSEGLQPGAAGLIELTTASGSTVQRRITVPDDLSGERTIEM